MISSAVQGLVILALLLDAGAGPNDLTKRVQRPTDRPPQKRPAPEVVKALFDPIESVRHTAMTALLRKLPDASAPIFIDILKRHSDPWMCDRAIAGLTRLGPKASAAVPILIYLLKNPEENKAKDAPPSGAPGVVWALSRIGDDALPEILKIIEEKDSSLAVRTRAVYVVDGMAYSSVAGNLERASKVATAVPTVVRLLEDKDDGLRQAAVAALNEIGPEAQGAIPALVKLVNRSQGYDRIQAAQALFAINPKNDVSIPVLIAMARNDPDPNNRGSAIYALEPTGDHTQRVVSTFVSALSDREVRVGAVYALSRLDHIPDEAIALLENFAKGTDDALRYAAKVALRIEDE